MTGSARQPISTANFKGWRAPPVAPSKEQTRTTMANTSSAKKATRKIARRAVVNGNRLSRVRTEVRKVDERSPRATRQRRRRH